SIAAVTCLDPLSSARAMYNILLKLVLATLRNYKRQMADMSNLEPHILMKRNLMLSFAGSGYGHGTSSTSRPIGRLKARAQALRVENEVRGLSAGLRRRPSLREC